MLKTISNSAENMRSSSRVHDENNQKIQQLKNSLNKESHLFIVTLGAIIGTIFSLFIAYHLTEINLGIYALLSIIPLALSYSLRKVYIHTLVHSQE